jgi:hypothetical protein
MDSRSRACWKDGGKVELIFFIFQNLSNPTEFRKMMRTNSGVT